MGQKKNYGGKNSKRFASHLPRAFSCTWMPETGHETERAFIYRPPLCNGYFFWQTVHACTLVSTSLQWPLSSVPKVAAVKRFNCRWRWSGEVVRHCFFLNIQEKATNEKFILEEAQRKGHKERRETGEEWIPKLFERDPAAPNAINRWVYKYRE